MASRVNVKFVVILATSLTALFLLVAVAGYMVLNKSGEDHVRIGEAHMVEAVAAQEQGDKETAQEFFKLASESFGKAVNEDRTRVDWLEKWRDALLRVIPETRIEYQKAYNEYYIGILHQLAVLQSRKPEAVHEFLGARVEQIKSLSPVAESWQRLEEEARQSIRTLERYLPDDPEAKTIHRYVGIAKVAKMELMDPPDAEREEALAALNTALEANPDDLESTIARLLWRRLEWSRATRLRREALAQKHWADYEADYAAARERFGDDPELVLSGVEAWVDRITQENTSPAARMNALRAYAGAEQEVVDLFMTVDPNRIPTRLVDRFGRVMSMLRPSESVQMTLALAQRLKESRPNDAAAMVVAASLLGAAGQPEEAIVELQKVVDLPPKPVSLDGLLLTRYRQAAVLRQAENAIDIWRRAEDAQTRQAALERAKGYRTALVSQVRGAETSPQALFIDAQIALAERRFQAAAAHLFELRTISGQETEDFFRLMAQALIGDNQIGAARKELQKWLEINPGSVTALVTLADIEVRLRNYPVALEHLREAAKLDPDNPEIASRQTEVQGLVDPETLNDPVRAELIKAELRREAGQFDEAAVIIEDAFEVWPQDVRLKLAMIEVDLRRGQLDSAKARTAKALEEHPDNRQLQQLTHSLTMDDPVAFQEDLINGSDDPEPIKLVRKFHLYESIEQREKADPFLDQAYSLAPEDRRVVEAVFVRALTRKKFDEARTLTAKAARLNLDDANGLMYQARLEMAQDQYAQAVATLNRAVQTLPFESDAWLLKGRSHLELGQVGEAVKSLEKALEMRPDDGRTARIYISSLMQLERAEDALKVARESTARNPQDLLLADYRLRLEELTGDKAWAIAERMRRFDRTPENLENAMALTNLLLDQEAWTRAKRIIDDMRTRIDGDTLDFARVEARWHAAQGNVDAGVARLRDQYIASIDPSELTAAPFLALGDFLLGYGRPEEAEAAFARASEFQSSEVMQADRRMGDFYFSNRRFADAAEPYKRIIDGGADSPDKAVTKRYTETLLNLARQTEGAESAAHIAEAKRILAGFGTNNNDLQVTLLRADIAELEGDRRTASRLLDRAVSIAPNDAAPFLRRARFNSATPELFNDVMTDLEQVLRLQPSSVTARRLRADMLANRGRRAEAVAELRQGIPISPESDELRVALVQQLLAMNAWGEAIDVVNRALTARSRSVEWLTLAGDLHQQAAIAPENAARAAEYWRTSAAMYREAYGKDPQDILAAKLINATLSTTPPNGAEALDLLNKLGPRAEEGTALPMYRARALAALGRESEARTVVAETLQKVETQLALRNWFQETVKVFGQQPIEAGIFIESLAPPTEFAVLYKILLAQFQALDPSRQLQVIATLDGLRSETSDSAALADLYRLKGGLEYQHGRYQAAEQSFAEGVKVSPNDLEFNNNLAYVRAKHVNNAAGAIAPAERASQLAPTDANVLDTLGWVYFLAGNMTQAQSALQRSIDNATTPAERLPALIHMSEVLLARNESRMADSMIRRAEEAFGQAPEPVRQEYQPDLERLKGLIGRPN